jgi:hypothetical protein
MPSNHLPVIIVVAAVLPILLISVISLVDIFFYDLTDSVILIDDTLFSCICHFLVFIELLPFFRKDTKTYVPDRV